MKFTTSMTRANKLLAKLREMNSDISDSTNTRKRGFYSEDDAKYGVEASYLTFSESGLRSAIEDIRNEVERKILIRNLIEVWKSNLFKLNIHYGIHDILSLIDTLKHERSDLQKIVSANGSKQYKSLNEVLISYKSVSEYDKKWDLKWQVSVFDTNEMKSRINEINKKLSSLDERKDQLNIQSSFSIELSNEQLEVLNIEV